MEEKFIYAIIIMVVIFSATLGFANTLNVNINAIGGKDYTIPQLNDIEIGLIDFQQTGSNFDRVTVNLRNTDSVSHNYEICAIWPNGIQRSDDAGTSADCATTASIGAGLLGSATVSVTNALADHDGTATITIERTS